MPLTFDECIKWMRLDCLLFGDSRDSVDVSRLIWVDESAVVVYRRYDTDDDIYIAFYIRSAETDARFVDVVNKLLVDEKCESASDTFDEICGEIGKWGHHYD